MAKSGDLNNSVEVELEPSAGNFETLAGDYENSPPVVYENSPPVVGDEVVADTEVNLFVNKPEKV